MYMSCRHIKTNGERCKSPALRGHAFCYFHAKLHCATRIGVMDNVQLPIPEDAKSIQLSLAQIFAALLSSRIDVKHSAQLLWGLQIAIQSLDRQPSEPDEIEPVRFLTRTKDGEELAPIQECCDDDDNCDECESADECPDYHGEGRDDEENCDEDEDDGDDEEEGDDEEDGSEDENNDDEEDGDEEQDGDNEEEQTASAAPSSDKELIATIKRLTASG
jgi:hypothetical protein